MTKFDYTANVRLEGPRNTILTYGQLDSLAAEFADTAPFIGKHGEDYSVTFAFDSNGLEQPEIQAKDIIETALGRISADWLKPTEVKVVNWKFMRELVGDPVPEIIQFPTRLDN